MEEEKVLHCRICDYHEPIDWNRVHVICPNCGKSALHAIPEYIVTGSPFLEDYSKD